MIDKLPPHHKAFIDDIIEVAEHLQVDNGKLTATEQYDLGEQLYCAVNDYESRTPSMPYQEAVEMAAHGLYNAKLARGGCGQLPWEKAIIHFPDNADRFRDDAKAALAALGIVEGKDV